MFKYLKFILPMLLLLPIQAKADSPSIVLGQSEVSSLDISDSLKNLPAVKEGFFYDIKQGRGLNILGLEVVTWKGFALDAAWIGVDGAGGVLNYSLSSLPVSNVPILSYVQYLNLGYAVGIRKVTGVKDDGGDPKVDNMFLHGPVAFIKIKF